MYQQVIKSERKFTSHLSLYFIFSLQVSIQFLLQFLSKGTMSDLLTQGGFKYTISYQGYTTIILHPGNFPLIQYSHLWNTIPNHGNIFSGVSYRNRESSTLYCRSSIYKYMVLYPRVFYGIDDRGLKSEELKVLTLFI